MFQVSARRATSLRSARSFLPAGEGSVGSDTSFEDVGVFPGWIAALLACLGVLAAFFLLRPAVATSAYYGPRSNIAYSYWPLVAVCFVPYGFAVRDHLRGAGRRSGSCSGARLRCTWC